MAYGTIKVDTVTFTDGGVDKSVSISGLVQNPTFSGNITVTGTVSGNTIQGQTVSGVTVTGTTALFSTGTFISLTGTTSQGTTATYTSGSFTSLTGVTTSGTTANFVSGVFSTQISGATVTGNAGAFTTLTGGVTTITSGVFAAGSAANPSISFTSDPDTGLYSPGANQVALSTNGTKRLQIDSGGNVSIDAVTDTGSKPLSIYSAARDSEIRFITNSGTERNAFFTLRSTTGNVDIYATTGDITLNPGNTERLRITSTGQLSHIGAGSSGSPAVSFNGSAASNSLVVDSNSRVGVGTASPTNPLHVSNTAGTSAIFERTGSNGVFVGLKDGSGNAAYLGNTNGTFSIQTAGSGYSDKLVVTSAGLVGIGTSSPSYLLDVSDEARIVTRLRIDGASSGDKLKLSGITTGAIYAEIANTGNVTIIGNEQSTGGALCSGGLAYATVINAQSAYPLQLATSNTARLTVSSAGNVGIGTTSPDTALTVLKNSNADFSSQANLRSSSLVTFDNSQATTALVFKGTTGNPDKFIFADTQGATQNFGIGYQNSATRVNSIQCTQNDAIIFNRNGSENGRWDSSGRLLVGTSSLSANVRAAFRGNSFGAGVNSTIYMMRDAANPVAGQALGVIDFTDSNEGIGAEIAAIADADWGTNDYPGRLVFSTTADGASSPTERMRITNGGEIQFGNTTNGAYTVTRNPGICAYFDRRTSDGVVISFERQGSGVGNISVTTTATAYNTSSDYRLKENVTPVADGITRLQQLKPSRFNFIADPDKTVDGFIAHEVQTIVPEAITGEKDAVDDEGNPVYQGIDQSKLVPLLTAALQEAITKIETLEAKVAALESA